MVFGEMIKQYRYRKAYAKGQAQVQALWESWNQRRLEAEAKGEPFTEPTPARDNHNGASR